jgi:hypothetical protein
MRRIKIIPAGAAAGLALLAFCPWRSPMRPPPRSDPPPAAPHEPIWRTCLRDIASDPDPTERAADLGRLAEALPGAELRAAIDELQPEAESSPGARLRLLLLRRWADQDPAAAATWVASPIRLASARGITLLNEIAAAFVVTSDMVTDAKIEAPGRVVTDAVLHASPGL